MLSHHHQSGRGRTFRISAIILAAAGATLVPALSANAATSTPQDLADTSTMSSWTDVDTGQVGYFDSSLDPITQIEEATGLPVVANPTTTANLHQSALAGISPSPAANFLLSEVYQGTGMSGASNSYFTTNPGICDGSTYGFSDLGDWDDRISSFQSFNGCTTKLYENPNFGGTTFGYSVSATTMGSFNGKASSASFH